MKLWILKPTDKGYLSDKFTWGCCFGMVIREENEKVARKYASKYASGEGGRVWLDEDLTSCNEIPLDGNADLILADVRNG